MGAKEKIAAYGFRKPGTVCIIKLLDDARGYSRKYSVLELKVISQLKSRAKFINDFRELRDIRFIKELNTNTRRIKLDKRVWDREPSVVKIEHNLIYKRLNQNARWINRKSLIRDIRNQIELKTRKKPSYYAVEAHLNFILIQNKYSENQNGLIRLAKFDTSNNETASNTG